MRKFLGFAGVTFAALVAWSIAVPPGPKTVEPLCSRGQEMIAATGGRVTREEVERTGVCDEKVAREQMEALKKQSGN